MGQMRLLRKVRPETTQTLNIMLFFRVVHGGNASREPVCPACGIGHDQGAAIVRPIHGILTDQSKDACSGPVSEKIGFRVMAQSGALIVDLQEVNFEVYCRFD